MEVDVDKSPSITPPVRAPPPQLGYNAPNKTFFVNANRTIPKSSYEEKAEMAKISEEVKKSLIKYTAAKAGWVASEVIYVHIRKKFPIKTLEKIGFITSKEYFDGIGVFLTAQHGDRLLVRYSKESTPVNPEVYSRGEPKPKDGCERVVGQMDSCHSSDQQNVHLDSFGRLVPRRSSNSRSPVSRKYRERGANHPKEKEERGERRRRLHERSREKSERRGERRTGFSRRVAREVRRERSRERTRYRESSSVNGREPGTASDLSKRRVRPSSSVKHSPTKDGVKELALPSPRQIGDNAAAQAKRAVTPKRFAKGKNQLSRRGISKLVDPSELEDNSQRAQKRSRLLRKHAEEKSGSRERSLTPMKVTITSTQENPVEKITEDQKIPNKEGSARDTGSSNEPAVDVKNLKPLKAPLFYGPAGNMRPMQSLDPSMAHSYQKCRYYLKGLCRKEDCLFLHDKIQLFIAPKHGRWKPKPREQYLGPAQSSEAEDQKAVEKLQKQSAYLGAIGHINSFPKVRSEKVAKVHTEDVILSEPISVPVVDLLAAPSLPFKHYLHGPKTMLKIGRWTPRGAGTEKSRTPVYSEEEDLDNDDPFADILSQHMTISNENPEGTRESGRLEEKFHSKDSSKKRRKSKEKRSKKKRDGKQARKANHRKKKHRKKKVESEEEEGEISEEECPGGVSKRELPSLFIGTDRPAPAAQRG